MDGTRWLGAWLIAIGAMIKLGLDGKKLFAAKSFIGPLLLPATRRRADKINAN